MQPSGRGARHPRRLAVIGLLGLFAVLLPVPSADAATWGIYLSRRLPTVQFASPTQVTNAGDGTGRFFIVEKRGTIRVIQDGALRSGYFLDIRSKVSEDGERGLLGLAFHPRFETNRLLFVAYTDNNGDIVIARFTANAAGTSVPVTSHRALIVIEHSARSNHNGGGLVFGREGFLYIGVGDGGGSGDPDGNGQDRNVLLGKILRIDVDGTGAGRFDRYANPRTNPYYSSVPGLAEIWSIGLRNPWRISVDRANGDLYIGDVGQGAREEVDRQAYGTAGGRNYGWNIMEGTRCNRPSACPMAGDTLPVAEYSHVNGNCSITGGHVYRGKEDPAMVARYVFADFCSGRIWTMSAGAGQGSVVLRADTSERITSFGESEGGELHAVTIDGKLFRVRTAPTS
jgi:glucose/arabinose dehydrogenase